MKHKEKQLAINLRKKGFSYSEIKKQINVSSSTLSLWLRDIQLSDKHQNRLEKLRMAREKSSKTIRNKRITKTKQIIKEAKEESKKLSKKPLFASGLMLYWAEGTKAKEMVRFTNSDPIMIKLAMKWFRQICKVEDKKIKIQINVHDLYVRQDIEKYWSNITNIPLSQFHKTIVKKSTLGYKKNKLYQGTCSIRISDVNLFRKIMGWKIGYLKTFNLNSKYHIPDKK